MRPTEKIEKVLEKFQVEVNRQKDKDVLDELLKAQAEGKKTVRTATAVSILRMSRIAAVAAVIAMAFWFLTTDSRNEPPQPVIDTQTAKAESQIPNELTNLASLNMAFRNGGIEAMDKAFDKAESKAGKHSAETVTVKELLCELGEC